MQRKLNIFVKKFDNVRFFLRPLCELQPLAALDANDIRHHTRTWNSGTDMAISLPHFTAFSKGRIKASKEVKTIISRGMCRFSVMPMRRLSVLSTPVAGSVRHIRDV